jgi:ParB-like chromosome segregation protein Spo0J
MSKLVFHKPIEINLERVHFATYNPRTISTVKMAQLKQSMAEHGVVLHLVVQKKADDGTPMVLIAGHQRVRAARELCSERGWPAPKKGFAVVLDVDDRTAKRLNVSLNRLGGDFEPHMLGDLLSSLGEISDDELLGVGFGRDEIDEIVRQALDPADMAAQLEQEAQDDIDGFARSVTLTVEFDTVERRDAAKVKLKALITESGRGCKPGVILSEALQAHKLRKPRSKAIRKAR